MEDRNDRERSELPVIQPTLCAVDRQECVYCSPNCETDCPAMYKPRRVYEEDTSYDRNRR